MPTITSNGTGGGNWSAGASWSGGAAPVDGDTVVIAAGDTITIDVDLTGWATGINGLTVTSSSGTPATLICSTSTGTYGLKMKASTQIVGTNATNKGIFQVGTSEAVPLPSDVTFTLLLGGTADNTIAQLYNRYLDVYFYANEPTLRWVRTTSAYVATDTVFAVDGDVTADATRPWVVGDLVAYANAVKSGTYDVEVLTITGVSSSTITCGAGLARNKNDESLICLISRNVKVLCQAKATSTYDLMGAGGNAHGVFELCAEVRDTRWAGGAGTSAPPNGDSSVCGIRMEDASSGWQTGIVIGGCFAGLAYSCRSSGAAKRYTRFRATVVGCDQIATSFSAKNADILAVCPRYAGASMVEGTLRLFAGMNGIGTTFAPMGGRFDRNSWIEYGSGFGANNNKPFVYWDGTLKNCNAISTSMGGSNYEFGVNSRIGDGCTSGITLSSGKVVGRGMRINHATPFTTYLSNPAFPSDYAFIGYDYADSSDVPQFGQIKAWMAGGTIAPDTPPGSPPVTLAFAHKMSHEVANFGIQIDIPLVLEAGTPLEIVIYLAINSGAYSWNTEPAFQLIDPAYYYDDAEAVVKSAIDANGAAPDATSTAWQTLYINYTLPITSNRPRGAKQNFVLRATGEVSDATGTPYWHWNYTQGEVVNANVQYVSGADEMITQMAKDVSDNQALIIAGL